MAITELQREKRLQSLGASDIPTILGLNPFQSAADLWLVKTGQVEPGDMSEAAEIGNALEAGIAPLCETRMGVKLVKPTGTFHAANGVMTANVDRMVGKAAKGSPIVEMKSGSTAFPRASASRSPRSSSVPRATRPPSPCCSGGSGSSWSFTRSVWTKTA